MSKLNVDEIRNGADSTTTPPSIPGLEPRLPLAWVRFNGSGVVSINSSHNVSSITDNGTGNFDVNYTTNLGTTDYAVWFSTNHITSAQKNDGFSGAPTATSLNVQSYANGVLTDPAVASVMIFMD